MDSMKKMVSSSKTRPSVMRGSSSAVDLRSTKDAARPRQSRRGTALTASKGIPSGGVQFDGPSTSKDADLKKMSKSQSAPALELKKQSMTAGVGEATRLARKFYLDLYEVKDIMQLFRDADTNGSGGLDKDEFKIVMAHVLQLPDKDMVPPDTLESAWKEISAKERATSSGGDDDTMVAWEASLDSFFDWYQANMFSQVCCNSMTESEKLTYKIAKDNDVTVPVIDKLKKKFDFFDLDKSGEIDEKEFVAMLCLLLGVKDPADMSEDRVKRFWKEIDQDGSGSVTFDEFCKWYLKYFNPDEDLEGGGSSAGPIGQFYKSFNLQEKHAKNNQGGFDE